MIQNVKDQNYVDSTKSQKNRKTIILNLKLILDISLISSLKTNLEAKTKSFRRITTPDTKNFMTRPEKVIIVSPTKIPQASKHEFCRMTIRKKLISMHLDSLSCN